LKLKQLVHNLKLLEKRNWNPGVEVLGVCSDSRRIKQGDVFFACPGPQTDGHQYFEEAYRRGASVCVGEKLPENVPSQETVFLKVADSREALTQALNEFYEFPSRRMKLIGVTGTNGKTTIAYLINYLLGKKTPSAYIGTLGSLTPQTSGVLSNTTPGSEELYSLLGKMMKEGIRTVSLEVSSHALDQKRVNGLEFELAVFTQLTPEHLDYHKSLEEYFQAKRQLFSREPKPKKILINQDSPYGRRLLGENPKAKSFSIEGEASYQAREIATSFSGSEFVLEGPRGSAKFRSPLPMAHNVSNVTAALASLDLLGYDPRDFQDALETFPGVPGRLERVEGNGFTVFIDYAHTPDAFENILSEARRLSTKRILTLFGCGGDRDPFKRPEMTRIAYQYSDFVILTSDNPRTEDPSEILRQMRRGLPNGAVPNVLEIADRREAISELLSIAEAGDIVLILGKGHEDYQILGSKKVHFDDREIVRDLLKRRSRVAL